MTKLVHVPFICLAVLGVGCGADGCAANGGLGENRDSGPPATGMDAGPSVVPPPSDEECYNGLDDDGDGLIDEMCPCVVGETQSCWSGTATRRSVGACRDGVMTCEPFGEFTAWGACVNERLPMAEIPDNGIDEDCDGGDEGGGSCNASEFGEGCGDGRDDDCDGLTDCADPDCASTPGCTASCVPAETGELCADGSDNDCDGLVDCLDPDCGSHESCAPPPPPPPGCRAEFPFFIEIRCGDGADNDCDGDVDCADSDCEMPGSCGCDRVETACSDGSDNDCDGDIDCADIDCQSCTPGSYRYCDEPTYCYWGRQDCQSDGRWGTCIEADAPPGCSDGLYSASCCVMVGECCQNYPIDDSSIGDCSARVTCLP